MNIKKFILLLVALPVFVACSKYDDTLLWTKLNENSEAIENLKKWQSDVNGDIGTLRGLITALQNNDYVTRVESVTTPPGGYIFHFAKSSPVTVTNGAKGDTGDTGATGQNGATPQIGAGQFPANSGEYYWTVNGEWLLDADGNKIPVTGDSGEDGQQGESGITPKLRVNAADTCWQISYDNETTWAYVLDSSGSRVKASGGGGSSVFASNGVDTSNPEYIEFTLADGTTKFRIPRGLSVTYLTTPVDTVPAGGRIDTLVIKSQEVWRLTSSHSWITLSPNVGIGSSLVYVTINPNSTASVRKDTLVFTSNGISQKIPVVQRVAVPATSISLNESSLTLSADNPSETHTLTATVAPANATESVVWSSSDDAIATVVNGLVTAKSAGLVTVTATVGSGTGAKSADCYITVYQISTAVNGVLINGVTWSACNVNTYRTFVSNPENAGRPYQWNRSVAWDSTGIVSNWDVTVPPGTAWETANDPSPLGWHVPTINEFKTLEDAANVTSKWITYKNIDGKLYIDRTSGRAIFLPVAGYRASTNGAIPSANEGHYWSATEYDNNNAQYLYFTGTSTNWSHSVRGNAYSVRPVKN